MIGQALRLRVVFILPSFVKQFFASSKLVSRTLSGRFLGTFCCLFLALSGLGHAGMLPAPFTLNAPFDSDCVTPTWLGHPQKPGTVFATLNLPITPPTPTATLLATVYFHEKDGGFLRVSWKGTYGAESLSDNFYEGIAMANQRSLIVPPETLANPGALCFQCGDTALGIDRIKLEWLDVKSSLVSSEKTETLVTPAIGATQTAQHFDGQPLDTDPSAWHDEIVTLPLSESAERVEDGADYSIQLDAVPKAGRLAFKEAGLSLSQHLVVWINQKRAGTVTPFVPELADGGYPASVEPSQDYVGWRDGGIYLPVKMLKTGINIVQFTTEDEIPSTKVSDTYTAGVSLPALALKDVVLQLDYPVAPSVDATTITATPPATNDDALPEESTSTTPAFHTSIAATTLRPYTP